MLDTEGISRLNLATHPEAAHYGAGGNDAIQARAADLKSRVAGAAIENVTRTRSGPVSR